MTISVAVAAIKSDNGKYLLIRRDNKTYNGLLALPGGKVEKDEHIEKAVKREIKEEAGINIDVTNYCGNISEHLQKDGEIEEHFDIKLFEADPLSTNIESGSEGNVGWYKIENFRDELVPSDLKMIDIIKESDKYYYTCEIDTNYELISFNSL